MARFKKNNDSIYDSLAQAYEAASISKITRYYPKHHKFEHTDIQQPFITSGSRKPHKYVIPPHPSVMDQVNEDSKRFVNETAEGLKYHLKLGMDNLSAKMASSSQSNRVPPAEASSYFTDKYVAKDFFESSTPIMNMMKRK